MFTESLIQFEDDGYIFYIKVEIQPLQLVA